MTPVRYWEVHRAVADGQKVFGNPVPAYSEWIRMLVGRALAHAQPSGDGERFEYLETGVPLRHFETLGDPAAYERAARAIDADIEVLCKSLEVHRKILKEWKPSPDGWLGYLGLYGVLARLSLPEKLDHWHVTDEGVSIAQWGLSGAGQRFFFDWTPEELRRNGESLRDRVLGQKPLSTSQNPAACTGRRDAKSEGNSQKNQLIATVGAAMSSAPSAETSASGKAVRPEPVRGPSMGLKARPGWRERLEPVLADRSLLVVVVLLAVAVLATGVVVGVALGRASKGGRESVDQAPAPATAASVHGAQAPVENAANGSLESRSLGAAPESTAAPRQPADGAGTVSDGELRTEESGAEISGAVPSDRESTHEVGAATTDPEKKERP
jgi:hypothetical protein